ncbi:hypothetical protein QNI19_07455 [Cytophagaceae bacterium DM2B3-1]|uniref:DUF4303 domain-containing protein n=1 Tax=Xanthocytophaga flava TaxID=3048013 RepID=A0ABT7CG93_9BACT|nr:hypothetical protein [Xanthocytophaga flavus]MDJ1492763.1 hypothetical protein [Xanthocytophaga flavus]
MNFMENNDTNTLLLSLKKDFDAHKINFLNTWQEIENQVSTWRLASNHMVFLDAFHPEMYQEESGKWLDERPEDRNEYVKVGLNSESKVIVEKAAEYEKRYLYLPNGDILSLQSDYTNTLDGIEKRVVYNGQQEWYLHYNEKRDSVQRYKYSYTDRRITKIESFVDVQQTVEYVVTYTEEGVLDSIQRIKFLASGLLSDQNFLIYKRNPFSMEELSTILINQTTNHIVQAIRGLDIQDPVYCIILVLFDAFGNKGWFPPGLLLGLERGKRQWNIDEWGNWNLDGNDFDFSLQLTDSDLVELYQLFMQECVIHKYYDLPSIVLKQIAQELRKKEIHTIIPTTDDFAIFTFDSDSPFLAESLEGIYSEEEINVWLEKWKMNE